MELDEIQTFVTIARLGGFGRAAKALHRSQPAISRRMEMLEAGLGAPLLERGKKGGTLTAAGRAFLPHAEVLLATVRAGEEAVRAHIAREGATVSLALVGTLAGTGLAARLREFAAAYRGVRLELRTARSVDISAWVRSGEVHLGLRYQADPAPQIVSETVARERMVVACAADHPLLRARGMATRSGPRLGRRDSIRSGKRRRVPLRNLAGQRWIALPVQRGPGEPAFNWVAQRLADLGLADTEVLPVDSLTAQKRLVEAGFGLALIPESGIQEELRRGTLGVLHVPALQQNAPICALYRRKGSLSPAAAALLALLRKGDWLEGNPSQRGGSRR